jgi:hypothetical protein
MPAIQPPPVPPARPATAGESIDRGTPRRLFDAVDEFVFTIYRTGFVQSLILHVAVLLLLALIIIRPDLPRPAAIALEFVAAGSEVEPDVAALELPALEPAELDVVDDAAPVPEPELAAVEVDATEVDAVEPAMFSLDDQPAGPDATALLADVPVPAAAGGDAAGDAGPAAGGGTPIGGEIGRRLQAAGAGTGDVQISIAWNNVNDIDLHVMVEPIGQGFSASIINFTNRIGVAGGCLDVDRNVRPTTKTPVENVFWGKRMAPFGRYTVGVHHFRHWGGGEPTEVEVVVLVDGEEERFKVQLRPGDPLKVVTAFQRLPKGGYTAAPVATLPPVAYPPRRPVPVGGYGPVRAVPMRPLK